MKRFIKTKEDFVCENCGKEVKGDGYTNHCPNCLYSKHVDINPGDRQAECGGLMKPIQAEFKAKEWRILHQCLKCGFKRKNKVQKGDNLDTLYSIMSRISSDKGEKSSK